MCNFAADSDIYQCVSSGDAHTRPVPWIEASWPEGGGGGETDGNRDGLRQREKRCSIRTDLKGERNEPRDRERQCSYTIFPI